MLRVLAVEREPVRLSELLAALGARTGRGSILDVVEALRRRSLVERAEIDGATAFTLQPVVLEYMTDRLVEEVTDEIAGGAPGQLTARPLIRAQAKEDVRRTQERLIGAPIVQRLNAQFGEKGTLERLLALLAFWRGRQPEEQGYAPGNLVNLLRLVHGGDLRDVDHSHLSVRQAYLAGVEAQGASLAGAHLVDSVLAEAFPPPLRVALSGDGALMGVGTSTGDILVYRMPDRAPLLVIRAHASAVWGVSLSADGRLLATGSDDGTVRLWELPGGRPVATLTGHSSAVIDVAFAGDQRLLASASADATVRVWSVPRGRELAELRGHTNAVRSVALSVDGRLLASGSADGKVRLWELPSGRSVTTLQGHTSGVWSVALSTDGGVASKR